MTKQHEPYRNKENIYIEILNAVKEYESKNKNKKERGGIYITKLLYMTRLTSIQLNNHIQTLLDNGLLIRDTTKSRVIAASSYRRRSTRGDRFHITEKGLQYLRMCEEIHRSLPAAGIHI